MNTAIALSEDFTPNDKQTHRWERAIANAAPRFLELSDVGLDYNAERVFAYQLLSRNDYTMAIAEKNPQSVLLAMVNLAATGLTLNPAHAYAYLVPRDGAIRLDISYKGFIKIATDSGAILWARADLVYVNDTFIYRGPAQEPEVLADPFGQRGAIRGAYCIAKTADGSILCEAMSLADLEHVRNCSDAWVKKKAGPWKDWPEEMMKKTVIKRARKTWPNSTALAKLDQAVEIANESEGGYTLTSQLRLAGSPNDGVWEAMDSDQQIALEQIAATMRDFYEAGQIAEAFDYREKQRLDTDEMAALNTRLESYIRTALKKEHDTRRRAAA